MTEDDHAEVLALVLTLAAGRAPTWYRYTSAYCLLCEAESPGAAHSLTIGQHHETCPYRQAVQLTERWTRG